MMDFHTVPLIPAEELLQLKVASAKDEEEAAAPAQVPVDAVKVLGEWEREAGSVAAKSTASREAGRITQFIRGAQTVYGDLGLQCIRGTPELVFGLTKKGADGIIAMASVNTLEFDDPALGRIKAAAIGYLAVAPTADLDDDVAARLFLEIKKWADGQGRYTVLTATTEEATEYYASVGMDTISPKQGSGLTLVYPKLIPAGQAYQSVTLGF